MTAQGLFITGTDTGVGKTVVTAAILAWLRHQGFSAGVMKPIETGVNCECSSPANSDALFLMECGGIEDDLAEVCPIRMKPAASPFQAALIENRTLQPESILSAYRSLAEKYDWMLVEGVGGIRVPITRDYGVVDLIRDLDLPTVVVARYQLGTLNHTLMTLDTLKQNGIPLRGVVFNQTSLEAPDVIEQDQPRLIEELSEAKILGKFPHIDNLNTQSFSPEKLKELEASVDFSGLIQK
ncbi:MAG: dethiobiotin synthase [Nitrospinota bacterium]|nr:dethiobiotin synthase [Nitrospinota bacterium]